MKLSIITINRNNAAGLDATLMSVASQSVKDFEYIVIDGASTDDSVAAIKKFESQFLHIKWVSESDSGIYNAMNKGIRMASGDYVQFLNSGDCLAADDVMEKMLEALANNGNPDILYGNMIKCFHDGRQRTDKSFQGRDITMLDMYLGTLNHSPAYIRRSLFDKFGMYDESLRIVSDWKWYLQAIIFGGIKPQYVPVDVTRFDMGGISETNKELDKTERRKVLNELVPAAIVADYDRYSFPMELLDHLMRHPWAYKLVLFLGRCLFKMMRFKL